MNVVGFEEKKGNHVNIIQLILNVNFCPNYFFSKWKKRFFRSEKKDNDVLSHQTSVNSFWIMKTYLNINATAFEILFFGQTNFWGSWDTQ